MLALSVGLLTLLRETASGDNRLTRELAADAYTVYIVHLPIVVTLQYYLADRGLSATAAWSIVSVTAVPRRPSCSLPDCAGCRDSGGCCE
ncbi:acyltransferase [Streptomyces ossamyceticus]|uniref:acyltransferase n=1 Tax=Streptomyces ossamyceticus TaxID=249581 RepID=UPI0036F04571